MDLTINLRKAEIRILVKTQDKTRKRKIIDEKCL